MQDSFESHVSRIVHRWRRAAWFGLAQKVGFFCGATAVAALLLDRILFELGWRGDYLSSPSIFFSLVALIGLATAVGCAWAVRRSTVGECLIEVDRRGGTGELLSSAHEIERASIFFEALRTRAAARAEALDLERIVPYPATRYLTLLGLVFLMGSVLLAFPGRTLHPPVAGFEASPVRGPAPLDIEFRNTSTGHISAFEWSFGDGLVSATESPAHRFEQPGRYTVRLATIGPRGTSVAEQIIEVIPPEAVFASFRLDPVKGHAPLDVAVENLSRNATTVHWDFGDGAVSDSIAPVHRFESPGRYTVRLEARNGGAADRAERQVHVLAEDSPLAEFVAVPMKGEAPLDVGFEDRSLGDVRATEWDFGNPYAGDGGRSSERNPRHVYTVPGVYTVRLKVRGPGGEDVETKRHYIRVESRGGSGGGGAAGGADSKKGSLFGRKSRRPRVEFNPEGVDPLTREGPWVEKTKRVYSERGEGGAPDQDFRKLFGEYRKQAEESIQRERVPTDAREFVRRYFEGIRPR